MTYQIKHTKKSPFGGGLLKTLSVFLSILAVIILFGFSDSMKSLALGALTPLFKTGNYLYDTAGFIPKSFSDKNKLIEENRKLSEEIENNRLAVINYESVKYENERLRQELGIKPAGNFISAAVIAKPPQIPLGSLFLDKGAKDGIKNTDLVLAGERILIGKIAEVSENGATVALNSSAGTISYGFVERTGEPIEIKGVGSGCMEAKVPIDFDIEVGDKIMLNDSLVYLAATVGALEEDQSSGFRDVLMHLPVGISKINVVFIKPNF